MNRSPRHRAEAGYNLVALMVIVTVLNVLVAAALPHWGGMAQREREEEAIFRGLQYAEAIRVFNNRFGRPPVRLEELVEVEPRSIRQLWGDPLNDDKPWGLVYAGQGGTPVRDDGGQGNQDGNLSGPSGLEPSNGQPGTQTQGPLAGVYSRAEGEAMKRFNGSDSYGDWQFTADLLNQLLAGPQPIQNPNNPNPNGSNGNPTNPSNPTDPGRAGGPGGAGGQGGPQGLIPPGGGPPDLSVRWLGRPWPEEIEQQMQPMGGNGPQGGGGLPGTGFGGPNAGNTPGNQSGNPNSGTQNPGNPGTDLVSPNSGGGNRGGGNNR